MSLLPRTTVFCAVYHKDPLRSTLIFDHLQNLRQQTVPVNCVYVFENGDVPPSNFPAPWLTFSSPLSIYEAWNLGITASHTDFLMNLNLDDRLHPDAIERLQKFIEQEQADLVGGDWQIKYSQADTDIVSACSPVSSLPFLPSWPPLLGSHTRLGSGTGERGTFGPATLWRRELHRHCPRYPERLADGTVIRSIGDALWWMILRDKLNKKMLRLPMIIGNYHSHPAEQAEFRYEAEWNAVRRSAVLLV